MPRDLMDQLVRWGNANKWIFSDVELVEFAEAFLPISHACTKAAREFVIQDNISACLIESNLKLPQGVSHETFAQIAKLINEKVGHISTDIYVHGSRAKGTGPISDIDFAIRVTPGKFEELLDICFGKPNYPSAKWKTWYHALNGGKIRSSDMTLHKGGINLSHFRTELERILGFDVDISIIKQGGSFDRGPLIYL